MMDIVNLSSLGLEIFNSVLNSKQISNDDLFYKLALEIRENTFILRELCKELKGDMNMIKGYIENILNSNDNEKLEEFKCFTVDIFKKIKTNHIEEYNKLELKLHLIANGKTFNKEMAEKVINEMRPYGMKWSLEDTKNVQLSYCMMELPELDFWVVMNSIYNDNKETIEKFNNVENYLEIYANLSKDFFKDIDADKNKFFDYFSKKLV